MRWILALGPLFFWAACSPDPQLLEGQWQAVGLYEAGQSLPVPLDSVRLQLAGGQAYSFRALGHYHEEGRYRCAGDYLFLTDSTARTPRERALRILLLSEDTLKLRMQVEGREQVLFLAKKR